MLICSASPLRHAFRGQSQPINQYGLGFEEAPVESAGVSRNIRARIGYEGVAIRHPHLG